MSHMAAEARRAKKPPAKAPTGPIDFPLPTYTRPPPAEVEEPGPSLYKGLPRHTCTVEGFGSDR